MGCDIHCIIEYKRPESYSLEWDSFGYHSINPGRNYNWFANLAGVRGSPKRGKPLATGFGLPEHTSWATNDEISFTVDYDTPTSFQEARTVNIEQALKWVNSGYSIWREEKNLAGQPYRITSPDYHTYGWCNLTDWKKAAKFNNSIEVKALTAAMQAIGKGDVKVRIVFWFDN